MIYTAGMLSDFEDVILENMSNFFEKEINEAAYRPEDKVINESKVDFNNLKTTDDFEF